MIFPLVHFGDVSYLFVGMYGNPSKIWRHFPTYAFVWWQRGGGEWWPPNQQVLRVGVNLKSNINERSVDGNFRYFYPGVFPPRLTGHFFDHVFVCLTLDISSYFSSWWGHMCFFLIIQWVYTLDDWWLRGLNDSFEIPPNLPTPVFFNTPESRYF